MFENLLNLIKENAGEAIINNPAIPNEKNDAAIQTATKSIINGLKGSVRSGGVDVVKQLFQDQGNVNSNPLVQNLSTNVAGDLMKKFGLNSNVASSIVSMLLPIVLSKLVQKTNDPNDSSFNLDDIIGSLTSGQGKAGGLLGTFKSILSRR